MAEVAPITDYASLKAAVIQMADRSDAEYVNSVPIFIQQMEIRLFRQLRCPGNETIATYLAGDGDNTGGISIPNDFLEAKWALYGTTPLERITDQRYFALMASSVVAAQPLSFARVTNTLAFYPPAASNEDVRLGYYEGQGPLSDADATTRMLQIAPFAYLYGTLAEGARFIRDTALMQMWEGKFAEELTVLNQQAYDNEVAGSTVMVRPLDSMWPEGW